MAGALSRIPPCTLVPEGHSTQRRAQLGPCCTQQSAGSGGRGKAQTQRLGCPLGGQEGRAPSRSPPCGRQAPSLLLRARGLFPRQLISDGSHWVQKLEFPTEENRPKPPSGQGLVGPVCGA